MFENSVVAEKLIALVFLGAVICAVIYPCVFLYLSAAFIVLKLIAHAVSFARDKYFVLEEYLDELMKAILRADTIAVKVFGFWFIEAKEKGTEYVHKRREAKNAAAQEAEPGVVEAPKPEPANEPVKAEAPEPTPDEKPTEPNKNEEIPF